MSIQATHLGKLIGVVEQRTFIHAFFFRFVTFGIGDRVGLRCTTINELSRILMIGDRKEGLEVGEGTSLG